MGDERGGSDRLLRWSYRIAVFTLAVCLLAAACSTTTKHRVLSFFLDGVPEPGGSAAAPVTTDTRPIAVARADRPTRATPRVPVYSHQPYRDNQCTSCHDLESGELVKSPSEGLCLICHRDVPGKVRYVHGPVAVNECVLCHHYHASQYPKLLLQEELPTCFQCHSREDLTTGEHHDDVDRRGCVDCHDPHGGSQRYFLKRTDL